MDPKPKKQEKPKNPQANQDKKPRFRVLNDQKPAVQSKNQVPQYCTRFDG